MKNPHRQKALAAIMAALKGIAIAMAIGHEKLGLSPQAGLWFFMAASFAKEICETAGDYFDDGKMNGSYAKRGVALLLLLGALQFSGCARFQNRQADITTNYDENGRRVSVREITTQQKANTFGPAKSDLTKFKATNTDKTQSATVGALAQESEEPQSLQKFLDLLLLVGKAGAGAKP